MRCEQKLEDFHAHAFARQAIETAARHDASVQSGGIRRSVAIGRVEAKEPQDPQIVFNNALFGIADKAYAAGSKVGEATDIVVERAVGCGRQSIDRKISPLGIGLPIAAKDNLGLAAIG